MKFLASVLKGVRNVFMVIGTIAISDHFLNTDKAGQTESPARPQQATQQVKPSFDVDSARTSLKTKWDNISSTLERLKKYEAELAISCELEKQGAIDAQRNSEKYNPLTDLWGSATGRDFDAENSQAITAFSDCIEDRVNKVKHVMEKVVGMPGHCPHSVLAGRNHANDWALGFIKKGYGGTAAVISQIKNIHPQYHCRDTYPYMYDLK